MKRFLLVLGLIAVLIVSYWLISPLFITKEVNEALPTAPVSKSDSDVVVVEMKSVVSGTFEGLAGHNSSGTARLIEVDGKKFIRFEDDFKVTNGPDLFVHFGKDGEYAKEAQLGELKGNVGSQNYEVPANIDPNQYNEVWVWCRAFSVPFAKAVLK